MLGRVRVSCLLSTPVKGLRVTPRDEVVLDAQGAVGDRRFYLVDDRGSMVNGKQIGALCAVVASCEGETLTLTFPAGAPVTGPVGLGATIATRFFSQPATARLVDGPWSDALSEHAGRAVRLVAGSRRAVDRGGAGAVTVVSRASVARLAAVAGEAEVDARRFRMLIELDGPAAHAEDGWRGRRLRVGGALIEVAGHVGRCLVTTRDPDTGSVDLPVLDLLRSYRAGLPTTEPLALGVYGAVLEPGPVRLGDPVALV
jgi:uncharacterized protein YcbX